MLKDNLEENDLELLLFRSRYLKQKNYWLKKLAGEFDAADITLRRGIYPMGTGEAATGQGRLEIPIDDGLSKQLIKTSKNSDLSLYILLLSALKLLIYRYTANKDIIIISPVNKLKAGAENINSAVFIRDRLDGNLTFKELVLIIRQSVLEAYENQDYPYHRLIEDIFSSSSPTNIACWLGNLHHDPESEKIKVGISFGFLKKEEQVQGWILFDAAIYPEPGVLMLANHFLRILTCALQDANIRISGVDFLTKEEKKRILEEFNNTIVDSCRDRTAAGWIEDQVQKTPDAVAIAYGNEQITYGEFNRRANRLAAYFKNLGVRREQPVGILMERSPRMVESILGAWKAGGAYIPLDSDYPLERIRHIIGDSRASLLATEQKDARRHMVTRLHGFHLMEKDIQVTRTRPQIKDFDKLPIPDRSMLNYGMYNRYIGQAPLKNSMTLQATRGCPFNCVYCHKIWPKSQVARSAENIFQEVKFLYDIGVRKFSFLDDTFNLNIKNSSSFFEMIIRSGMKLYLSFPNGLRGDLLTTGYIDLMIEAGTMNFALALETASPRLQKLIGKNQALDKFDENTRYICEKYPGVILELFTMLGFPTETEEEAMMTLNFIKGHRWFHFPYISILKIFPNSDMEKLALENGVSKQAILRSENMAFHDIPETSPLDKAFILKYQADFFNGYFLDKERLLHVLPRQMKLMTEGEIVQKYNSYLPVNIHSLTELLEFVGISREELGGIELKQDDEEYRLHLDEKLRARYIPQKSDENALRILLMDLSQFFSHETDMLYDVVEPPLGLMYLMTYLKQRLGTRVTGKIVKSRVDFDNFAELKTLLEDFKPDVIGIRTLTLFRDFFHRTIAIIRRWGVDVPVITGGPYATSSFKECLQDRNIDLAVLGEGELTFEEVIRSIMANNKRLPGEDVLKEIPGIAYMQGRDREKYTPVLPIVIMEELSAQMAPGNNENTENTNQPSDLAYIIYTSGSTGKPKGVMVEQSGMMNHIQAKINDLQITDKTIVAQNASHVFDISVWQFFTALTQGGKTIIYPNELIFEPERFISRVIEDQVSVLEVVPSYLSVMLEYLDSNFHRLNSLKYLLVTGETIKPTPVSQWFGRYPHIKMVNAYGPTEASDDITHFMMDRTPDLEQVPIGKPLPNLNIFILDEYMNLCPLGVVGEICVTGIGVGRGYLNKPELTADRFIKNKNRSYGSYMTYILYKTGDLGYWSSDGNLTLLGRKDFQVKVRGFRIELGEIEGRLANHPDIKEAAVIVKTVNNSYLCAYLVPVAGKETDIPAIKEYLADQLPVHMIPDNFVQLDHMPLTPNGKIDRKALSLLDDRVLVKRDEAAPLGKVEKELVQVWADVLGIPPQVIGIDANFFELGGNSLGATILISRLNKVFNIKIPLVELFQKSTVRELAQYIGAAEKEKFIAIQPVEKKDYYVLSSAQKRIYILQQMDPAGVVYNISATLELQGTVNIEQIRLAFLKLVQRHESLRTSFEVIDQEPVQRIRQVENFEIEYYELPSRVEEQKFVPQASFSQDTADSIHEIMKKFIRPFSLSQAPLFRVGLIHCPTFTQSETFTGKYILIVDMHHIITDQVSIQVLAREFKALYAGHELPGLKLQYKDYSEWFNGGAQEKIQEQQEAYWLDMYRGEIPVLNMPMDYPRTASQAFQGSHVYFEIGREETRALKLIALKENVTPFILMMTIFYVFLSILTGQEDIIVGTDSSGRQHADLEGIIGMFINTLALRNFPTKEKTFKEFLHEVRERILKDITNQGCQFEKLVDKLGLKREPGRNPLFDVMFALQTIDPSLIKSQGTGNLEMILSSHNIEINTAKFDMLLVGIEMEDNITFTWEYCTTLYKEETIRNFINYFKEIISIITRQRDILLKDIKISHNLMKAQTDKPSIEFGF